MSLSNNNNNNIRLVTLAEHTSDHSDHNVTQYLLVYVCGVPG